MKQTLLKLVLGIVAGHFNVTQLVAGTFDDYGRDYVLRGNSSLSIFLTTVFTIGVVIFLIYFFIVSIYYGSKDKNNTDNGTNCNRNSDINNKRQVNTHPQYPINKGSYTCPTCKGKGWIKGSEVFGYSWSPPSGKHQCQHCKGYGRVLTQKAEELIVELQKQIEEYNKRRKEYAKSAEEKRIEKIREERITLQKKRSEYFCTSLLSGYRQNPPKRPRTEPVCLMREFPLPGAPAAGASGTCGAEGSPERTEGAELGPPKGHRPATARGARPGSTIGKGRQTGRRPGPSRRWRRALSCRHDPAPGYPQERQRCQRPRWRPPIPRPAEWGGTPTELRFSAPARASGGAGRTGSPPAGRAPPAADRSVPWRLSRKRGLPA